LLFLVLILCRGSGEDGQLGMGGNEEKDWAHCVEALGPYAVTAVVAGSRNSLAICDDGRVRPLPLPRPLPAACCSCLLFISWRASVSDPVALLGLVGVPCRAQLFTWGWNQRGTLGHPPETKTESSPGPVDALAGVKIVQVRLSSALPARLVPVCCCADETSSAYGFFGSFRRRLAGGIASQLTTRAAPTPGVGAPASPRFPVTDFWLL